MKIRSLYVYADKQGAGSLLVTLGLMNILKKSLRKVAFFRPIVQQREDYDCRFIKEYFGLDIDYNDMWGYTIKEAEHMIAIWGEAALYEGLIKKYKKFEKDYDFILCEGVYSDLFSNIVELDINIEIAKNFSASVLNIINAEGLAKNEIIDLFLLQKENMKKGAVNRLATVINRVQPRLIKQLKKFDTDIYAIPETVELTRLSLADIVESLKTDKFKFNDSDYARKVTGVKVAAMSLDNYLSRITQGDLVIVPADRSEIILGLLGSFYSRNFPSISGIIFSNGLEPHENIKRLIDGLANFTLPILLVEDDTYTTAKKISNITPKIRLSDKQKISLCLGIFAKYVNTAQIESKLQTHKNDIVTPQMFEYKLFELARKEKKKIVLPEAHDIRVLQAAEIILNRGIADIIFLENPQEFKRYYEQLGLDLSKAEVVDYKAQSYINRFGEELYRLRKHKGMSKDQAVDAVTHVNYFATMMVHLGMADGMVSGATHSTAETVRPALQIIKTKEDVELVSSIFFMCLDTKVLVFGDCAIVQDPNVKELADIAISANDNAKRFGIEPRVAMISYSSGESAKGVDVEKVREATRIIKEKREDIVVDGPMQFDAAFDPVVAKKKMPDSKVAGEASVYIFPNLNTGNTTYKAVQRSSNAGAIGPILQGLKKPVNDLSRGCTLKDIVNTIAITAIQAQGL